MKNFSVFHFVMVLSVGIQAVLGIVLTVLGIYADSMFYTRIDGFFLHFAVVPGAVVLLCLLHFLAFKKYDKKFDFVTTSGYIAFVVTITGEILVLFYNMFPAGFIGYVLWLILAAGITAFVVMGLNMLYIIGYMAVEKAKANS